MNAQTQTINTQNIPAELKEYPNWVVWKLAMRDGKQTKPLYDAKSNKERYAKSNDPSTWASFEVAISAFEDIFSDHDYAGVGFVLKNTPFIGVDFDGVIHEGKAEDYVLEILNVLGNPYSEITPSGNGLRAFVTGVTLPTGGRKFGAGDPKNKYGAEIYSGSEGGRYLTVTGNKFSGKGIPTPENINLAYFMISQITNTKLKALWMGDMSAYGEDHSKADLALLGILAQRLNNDANLMEEYFSASRLGQRDKWTEREDYRKRSIEKVIGLAPAPTPAVPMSAEVVKVASPTPVVVSTLGAQEIGDMSDSVLQGRLGEICQKRLKAFPISYSWPALVTVAGVIVPSAPKFDAARLDEDPARTNLYTVQVGSVGSGKSQVINHAKNIMGLSTNYYSDLKAGSSEGLLLKLSKDINNGRLAKHVLQDLDEWKHYFKKAEIDGASFMTIMNTGFYKDHYHLVIKGGKEIDFKCSISWIGGIVQEEYGDVIGSSATGGFYDRLLQGVCPTGYMLDYKPYEGQPEIFDQVSVEIDGSVWEAASGWRKLYPEAGRAIEVVIRAAHICASFDGRSILYGKDLEPAEALLREQLKIRSQFAPNVGENTDAKCQCKIREWLKRVAPNGEWVNISALSRGIQYTRFGNGTFARCVDAMKSRYTDEIETVTQSQPGVRDSTLVRLKVGK